MDQTNNPIENIQLLIGSLSLSDGTPVPYWPVEISQFTFYALTDQRYPDNATATLQSPTQQVRLKIVEQHAQYGSSSFSYIRFESTDKKINIESCLRSVPELRRWNAVDLSSEPIKLPFADLYVRAARFFTARQLRILARTFGTRGDYVMCTENVSKSGMLLKEGADTAPFAINTIVELTIDPEANEFNSPVYCLAKIVRCEGNHPNARFGIQLIDMEPSAQNQWSTYVENLERSFSQRAS